MRLHLSTIAASWLFLTVSYAQPVHPLVHPMVRIRTVPDDTRTVKLTGNTSPLARPEYDAGAADPSHPMDRIILALNMSDDQKQALDALIAEQQDPASPQYQKWLTAEAFADQFGVSQNDVDQVAAWLSSHGFRIDEVPTGRRTIVFSGTAGMVQSAFHTEIRQYRVNGELHYANASDPEIPEALAPVVLGTVTLHDFGRTSMKTKAQAVPEFSSGGAYYLAPADLATIYNLNPLYTTGNDGTGQSVAIVGRTNINLSDVTAFRSYFGLPANNPQMVVNGTNPGITSDVDEALLDVEWSGAVARGAAVKLVVSASTSSTDGVDLSAQYIVSNNLAHVMSTSYGSCESAMGSGEMAFYSNLWQQASVEGISATIAAGDSGAAGCDSPSSATASYGKAVNGLCSTIYSVCVGGTEFNDSSDYAAYWLSGMNAATKESAISYIPEMAWNQSGSVSGGSDLWAGGGGASAYYAKPSWQSGPGVPADGKRDVPDVSLAASTHDAFLIVENGYLYAIGGTSAAAPSFAGIMAMVDQRTGSAQGNPNPKLYALAALQAKGTVEHPYFHDVTSGSNTVPGLTGYNAGAGYDQATGLGSVNGMNLAYFWNDASVTVPPSMSALIPAGTLTIAQDGSGTSTVNIAVAGGFNSAVTLSVSGAPSGVTATLTSKSFSAPGSGTSVLTVAASAATASQIVTLTVTASGGGITSTANVVLTIMPAFRLTKSVDTVAVQQGSSAGLTLTSTAASGFSGAVVLTAALSTGGALPAGVTLGFAPSTIASGSGASAVTITASSSAAAGTYSITIKGTSGSLTDTAVVPVTVAPGASFTLTAGSTAASLARNSSVLVAVATTVTNGFSSVVNLTVTGLPAGVTAAFTPATIANPAAGSSSLKLSASSTAVEETVPITITATSVTGVVRTAAVNLTVHNQ